MLVWMHFGTSVWSASSRERTRYLLHSNRTLSFTIERHEEYCDMFEVYSILYDIL